MNKLKKIIILLSVILMWYTFALSASASSQGYQVVLTSYTCEVGAHNPMYPCGPLRWGGNVNESGLACPAAWRNRRFEIPGYGTFRCDDTPFNEYLYELPHVDLRVPTVYQARQIGIRRVTIYDANLTSANTSTEENKGNLITYTVSPGDTLSNIAEQYNTTVSTIRLQNNLASNTIRIGQRLQLPQAASSTTTINTATTIDTITTTANVTVNSAEVHVVVPGDTLSGIAAKYNTTVDAIRTNNELPSYTIRIGHELQVSGSNNTEPTTSVASTGSNTITHTVRQGESIHAIAREYKVSYISILDANNLQRPNLIRPGQELAIPQP